MAIHFFTPILFAFCITTSLGADESAAKASAVPAGAVQSTESDGVAKAKVPAAVMDQFKLAFETLRTNPALAAKRAEELLKHEDVLPKPLLVSVLWIQGSGLAISEDYTQACDVLDRAELLARSCDLTKELRRILRYKAAACFECSRFQEGLDAATEAIAISVELNDKTDYVAALHNEAANNEFALGNMEAAIQHMEQAIAVSERYGDTVGVSKWLVNASNYMLELRRHDQCIEFCNRVLKLEGSESTSLSVAAAHGILGEALVETGFYQDARHHLQTSLNLCDAKGASSIKATTEAALGKLFTAQQNVPQAILHHTNALQIFQELSNPSGIASAEQALRNLRTTNDPKAQIDAIAQELARTERSGEVRLQVSLHKELSQKFAAMGRWRNSALHAAAASDLDEKLHLSNFNDRIASLLSDMSHTEQLRLIDDLETEVSARSELLKAQEKWNKALIACVCIMLVVIAVVGCLLFLMRKALRDVRIAKEELRQQELIRIAMERRLAEQQKSESLSSMAAGIAHDFNNLLSAIAGLAELAAETVPVSEKDELLRQISETSLQASGLTGQLMQFLGKPGSNAGQCDVAEVLKSTGGLLQSIARPNHVKLTHHEAPLPVDLDDTRLRQILINLVANAAEASEWDGEINVNVELIQLSLQDVEQLSGESQVPAGEYCRISVQDSGHGMSDDTRTRLFDPYFSTKGVGRGLGLSSVVGIVRSCGGFVKVESAPEQGCQFNIYLQVVSRHEPTTQCSQVVSGKPQHNIKNGSSHSIMIVDDEQLIRDMQSQYLRMNGFDVVTATSAEEAIQLVRSESGSIDCVVTDFCMSGKDGKWLAQQIKVVLPNVPVILCSGFANEDLEVNEHIDIVLAKPYSPKLLVEKINGCLQNETSQTPEDVLITSVN